MQNHRLEIHNDKIGADTGGPLLTLSFETLEKQPCKQKTVSGGVI